MLISGLGQASKKAALEKWAVQELTEGGYKVVFRYGSCFGQLPCAAPGRVICPVQRYFVFDLG